MATPEAMIALLIDADNAPASKITMILSQIAQYGEANIRRAYGNWKSPSLQAWESCLHEYAIRPIQQFAYTKGKNASDLAMTIDAMDLLYTQRLDAIALVSSDSDFTPLVMRLRANGLKVYGFGEEKTPTPFVKACTSFHFLEPNGQVKGAEQKTADAIKQTENPSNPSYPLFPVFDIPEKLPHPALSPAIIEQAADHDAAGASSTKKSKAAAAAPQPAAQKKVTNPAPAPAKKSGEQLKHNTVLLNRLYKALDDAQKDDGWADLASVGSYLSKQAGFTLRSYGYSKLRSLFEAIDLFEVQMRAKAAYVRRKSSAGEKKKKASPKQKPD